MQSDEQRSLTAALGRVPSGLFILTLRHRDRETGMLASWVQQCSFDPPQVSVAVKSGRFIGDWLRAGAAFTVNILDDTQSDAIGHFGRGFQHDEEAFHNIDMTRRPNAAPILNDALAHLDCQLVSTHPAGDHDLYIGRVLAGAVHGEGRPMVHVRKSGAHY